MLGPGPGNVKWAGVADGFRVPKPGAAIYQTQGDPAVRPVIIPVFFWEAGGAVPAPSPTVMIASNCERLEVWVGGTHVASALPAFGSPLYGGLIHPPFLVRLPKRIPHPAPELLVQGFVGGRPAAQLRMSANPAGDALAMTVDDDDHLGRRLRRDPGGVPRHRRPRQPAQVPTAARSRSPCRARPRWWATTRSRSAGTAGSARRGSARGPASRVRSR